MTDFVFNVALGRIAELVNRVENNDPANAALVVVVINTTATDATLKDLDTLAAVIANANTVEAANTGYARIVLDQDDTAALSPDDANDRMDIDLADFAFGAITDDDVDWTDILICYDPDTTGGDDSAIIPLTCHDFAVTIDGTSITAQLNAAGFFRAS
jgi:hypothetical protein